MNLNKLIQPLIFDHLVIVVTDLEKNIEILKSKGFCVTLGGINGPTKNALVLFQDGVYIELIAARSRLIRLFFRILYLSGILKILEMLKRSVMHRFFFWFGKKDGICDICISVNKLDLLNEYAQKHNLSVTPKKKFIRQTPEMLNAEWLLMGFTDRNLPFFIEDVSERSIRAPFRNNSDHKNKIRSIQTISFKKKEPIFSGNKLFKENKEQKSRIYFTLDNPDIDLMKILSLNDKFYL